MYQRILVIPDGSELSEIATPRTIELVGYFDAALHLLQEISRRPGMDAMRVADIHVPQSTAYSMDKAREQIEHDKADAGKYLSAFGSRLIGEGTSVKTAALEGYAHGNILEYVLENRIDLAIMSTHGYGGFKRILLGSVTDHIIRSGELPALVVPSESSD